MVTLQSYPSATHKVFAISNPLYYTFNSDIKGSGAYNSYSFTASIFGSVANGGQVVVSSVYNGDVLVGDAIKIVMGGSTYFGNVVSINIQTINYSFITDIFNGPQYIVSPVVSSINNFRVQLKTFHGQKEVQGGALVMSQVGGISEITPDIDGKARFDVGKYIRIFKDYQKTLIESGKKNTVDNGCWGRFYVQYRSKYDGDGQDINDGWTPSTPGDANMRYWLAGSKQLKSIGDVSMFPFVNVNSDSDMGKFLSSFEEPEYYVGYPNEVSFYWSKRAALFQLNFTEQDKTINNVNTGTVRKSALLTAGYEALNRVFLNTSKTSGFLEIGIEINAEGTEEYVEMGYVNVGYFESI